MTGSEIHDLVDDAILSIEKIQIEKGNEIYRYAFITGVLTSLLKMSLSGNQSGVITYLKKQINLKKNGRTENR